MGIAPRRAGEVISLKVTLRGIRAALANPCRSETHEWSEWMEGFDPEHFSVEIVDARVGARMKSQSA